MAIQKTEKRFHTINMASRVLIITYYWPPAGGPGVQRWLNFVKYFRDFDVEPMVYIPENPEYPLVDVSFESEVPPGIEILKHPIKEPYRFASILSKKKTKNISSGIIARKKQSVLEKMMLYIRGNFFIPDARVGWVKPSVTFLKEYLLKHPVDVLITTGPPHSLHLIGMQLQQELGLRWIADFRDPWTTIHYHKSLRLSKSSAAKHKELERQVLNSADQIVVTSPTTKKEFRAISGKPIAVITNGYVLENEVAVPLDNKFTLVHVGSLLSERDPEVLWMTLQTMMEEIPDFQSDFQLKLVGAVSPDIEKNLANYGLIAQLEKVGYVTHEEALRYQKSAQVLLLIEMDDPDTKAIIPGKLFEYLAAKRPILAIGPMGSDILAIVAETNTGKFFEYTNHDALKQYLVSLYTDYKQKRLSIDAINIEKYSRKELTRAMAQLIKGG